MLKARCRRPPWVRAAVMKRYTAGSQTKGERGRVAFLLPALPAPHIQGGRRRNPMTRLLLQAAAGHAVAAGGGGGWAGDAPSCATWRSTAAVPSIVAFVSKIPGGQRQSAGLAAAIPGGEWHAAPPDLHPRVERRLHAKFAWEKSQLRQCSSRVSRADQLNNQYSARTPR